MKLLVLLGALGGLGCSTAHLIGARPPMDPIEAGPPRVVIVEQPLDRAEWKGTVAPDAVDPSPTLTLSKSPPTRTPFTRPEVLAAIHEQVVPAIRALRPHWTVGGPGSAPEVKREAVVVRTVIARNETVESDRTLKNAAFAFGLVLLPLQILAAFPVEETERISGLLERTALSPRALQERLVKHAARPDFALNLTGLPTKQQPFALDVAYEEGLFADERPRLGVLVEGFVERLAFAIVTLIEEDSP